MRKAFDRELPGQSKDAWAMQWDISSISENYLFARDNTYMKYIFDRYFLPGLKILEGGCGPGYYVMCYKNKGCDIVGVDFSPQVIDKVKLLYPDLPVQTGNIENLRFEDNTFDVYYSGGVVEHFEEGPFKALKEALRVLKKDGILIITVPFLNIARRIKDYFYTGNRYKITNKFEKDAMNPDFSLYYFSSWEFKKLLNEAGFKILFWHGCSAAWGFRNLKVIDALFRIKKAKKASCQKTENSAANLKCGKRRNNPIAELLKDVLIRERRDKWYLCPIVSLWQSLFGNLVVFVCRKN
jgi:ubiquinone/menaquinone biosynthesis C-methylase UbiE